MLHVFRCSEGYVIAQSVADANAVVLQHIRESIDTLGIEFTQVPDDECLTIHDENDPDGPCTRTAQDWIYGMYSQNARGILSGFND